MWSLLKVKVWYLWWIWQNLRDRDEETRRASSYHSYSQSPPYDYQYEDRRYGKQAAVLTRKPGSDRGLYDGKISSFVYSPGCLSDQMYEDRFANDGSCDPFRSNIQSPNFQKGIGFSSPPIHPSRDILIGDAQQQTINTVVEENSRRDGFQRPQVVVLSTCMLILLNKLKSPNHQLNNRTRSLFK